MSLAIEAAWQMHPAQVGDLTVFDEPNSTTNHLTNNIHPIWAYRNWSRNVRLENVPRLDSKRAMKIPLTESAQRARCRMLPHHTFERILPALRLASLFLEKSLPWFWNVRYAPFQAFGKQKQTELVLDKGEWTQHKQNQIRRDLDIIAQRYFILHGIYGWDLNALGMSVSCLGNLDADVREDPDEDIYTVYWQKKQHLMTVIAKEAMDFIGSQKWPDLPLAIQQRCLFELALLLMHELAHIMIFYRADDELTNNEPYFRRTEPDREMGYSWEHYMFGGHIAVVDGELTGIRPSSRIEDIGIHIDWHHSFHSHCHFFQVWKHQKFRMDDLKHPPGRWLVATKSIEQFFDMRRWHQWLAMPVKHGLMNLGPFVIHLSPSLFMSLHQEMSMSFDIWYFRRLYRAAGLNWPDVINYDSHYSDTDWSPPTSPSESEEDNATSSGNAMDTESE